jgi:RimJ/RimL family protein N-acetyltransferase
MKSDVLLRDVNGKDLPIFFEHQLDKDANQMAAFPPREREAFMEHWTTKILGDKTVIKKSILFKGIVAGHIVSWEQSGKQEVGYWIGKEYWGKGIAISAVSELLGFLKVRPLYAYVAKHNIASLKVLKRCGFKISSEANVSSKSLDKEVEEFILKLE